MLRASLRVEALEERRFLSVSPAVAAEQSPPPTDHSSIVVNTTATTQPSEGGLTLTKTATQHFTAKLGEVTVKVVDLALNAVVDWGDGTHSPGRMVGSYATGEYYVLGTHTYAKAGSYKVDVKIFARLIGSPIEPTSPSGTENISTRG